LHLTRVPAAAGRLLALAVCVAAVSVVVAVPRVAAAAEVHIAVAANFTAPMKIIAAQFARETGHTPVVSFAATGKLYAQIKSGAPFDVFLSADDATPARLEKEGGAVPGTRFTYAIGRLVLWSAQPNFVDDQGAVLQSGNFTKIALASPKLAPYGAAAVETLTQLNLLAALQPKFVQGESIGQAYGFVATGNAALGFVALSQVFEGGKVKTGSAWIVPNKLHRPLRQDAVLLLHGKDNRGAADFMRFLATAPVAATVRAYGYETSP
jgi:molybdate transport system substrate-binding protein